MDFIQQAGTRYLEGKVNGAPQQLENFAKKQFKGGDDIEKEKTKSSKSNKLAASDEEEDDEKEEKPLKKKSSRTSAKEGGRAHSEKDLEIARLRGELEEARRARGGGGGTQDSHKKEEKASKKEESSSNGLSRQKSTKGASTRALPNGFKVVNGALVADAASRRHREKRPAHNDTKKLGKTVDNKGLGVAGGALVAGRGGGRDKSKSRYAAQEPVIVEAAPRSRRRAKEESEEEGSTQGSSEEEEAYSEIRSTRGRRTAYSTPSRRSRRPASESPISSEEEDEEDARATIDSSTGRSTRRSSAVSKHSTLPTTARSYASLTAPSKSSLSHRPRRASTASDQGSLIASGSEIAAIRRRQRGRSIADAEIDTAAPETPSLRALSRRRRQLREAEEDEEVEAGRGGRRGGRHGLGLGPAHLPIRSRSVVRESLGGESVVDVLEVDSVGFRPRRESGGGKRVVGRGAEGRIERERGPVVRRIEAPDRGVERDHEVELVRREGGRSVYRVR